MKLTSALTALIAAVLVFSATQTASAQLPGLKQFDPFNRNSKIRQRGRDFDKARRVEGRNLANGYKRAHGVPNPLNQNSTRFRGYNKVSSNTSFRYTIVNQTSTSVRFRLPSGKVYTLRPRQQGNYSFSGPATKARMHVYNSGRSYQLRSGSHKFWTMKNGRVGFDANYRRPSSSNSSRRRPSSSSNRRPRR